MRWRCKAGGKRCAGGYRYGFNGKENDNEVGKGDGGQQDYGMRVYDPRLGRFLSVDPITKQYPELTPYQFASNTPLWAIDVDGLEGGISGMMLWKKITTWWNNENSFSSFYAETQMAQMGKPFDPNGKHSNGVALMSVVGTSAKYYLDAQATGFFGPVYVPQIKFGKTASNPSTPNLSAPQTPKTSVVNTPGLAMLKTVDAVDVPIVSPVSFQRISAKSFSPQNGPEFTSYNTVILDGKITIPGKGPVFGQFDYVVTMDNKLKIGQGHFNLSEDAPVVQAAGGLSIKNGVVKAQNNSSGHYRPTPMEGFGSDIVLQLLGIKTGGAWSKYYSGNGKTTVVDAPPRNRGKD